KKRSSFKSMFAAFLAGAIVVSGLMFASDQLNLFGGDTGVFTAAPTHSGKAAVENGNSNGGVKNAVFPDVVRPNNIAQIVQNASPAVVKIETFVQSRASSRSPFMDDPFFRQFFGDFGDFFGDTP